MSSLIIPRRAWNAIPPSGRYDRVPMARRTEVIVHHSAGPADQSVRSIQRFHMDERGWNDIGYNFLIRTTGEIFEGRGWHAVGSHTLGHNTDGIGVCLIGRDQITDAAKNSLRSIYRVAVDMAGHALQIRGHRDHAATACPGDRVYRWITSGALDLEPRPVLSLTTPRMVGLPVRHVQSIVGAPIDGIYGPITERMVRQWQKNHGLVPDGIVGPLTWAAMGVTGTSRIGGA